MKLEINLPDGIVAEIDAIAPDRSAFIASAVVRMLSEVVRPSAPGERLDDDVPEVSTVS